ncbi:MAG: DUF2785 domain-containing protein [Vicinamibacterales bacterium]
MSTRRFWSVALAISLLLPGVPGVAAQSRTREQWVALAKGGFVVPAGETAAGLLVEMNALLASPDPVLRDEVAYSAAERWILRDKAVEPGDLRRLLALWTANLGDGLGTAGDDRVFRRSFSALCLSLMAARDVATPFLTADEAHGLTDRLFDYLTRERDLRGFDAAHGWMHAVAHTSDAFKFLARGRYWRRADLPRLLSLVSAKTAEAEGVFQWGEPQRMAFAIQAAVRREDADTAAVEQWIDGLQKDFDALWANGPVVVPRDFARVENRLQVLRGLHAALSMDASPTPQGEAVRQASIMALSRMR